MPRTRVVEVGALRKGRMPVVKKATKQQAKRVATAKRAAKSK